MCVKPHEVIDMKKIALVSAVIIVLLCLVSCDNNENLQESNKLNYGSFLRLLDENGFSYEEMSEETVDNSFLSVSRKPISIGDELISIYEYNSNEAMEEDSQYIDKGGFSINCPGKSVQISWASLPHFFKKDLIIVNYVGEDKQILAFLKENLGDRFAGYGEY